MNGDSIGLDPSVFWTDLAGSRSLEECAPSWLASQMPLIGNAVQGVVILKDKADGSFTPVAQWPQGGGDHAERLAEVSERSLSERIGFITELSPQAASGNGGAGPHQVRRWGIAYPLLIDAELHGVVALEIDAARQEDLRAAMEQLQWGMLSLELIVRRVWAREDSAVLSRLRSAIDVLASVLAEEDYNEACMTFATGLATLMQCDRVSLGIVRKNDIHVQAISHSANFDKRMNFVQALSMAMDEAILQQREIMFPPPPGESPLVTRSHEDLSTRFGAQNILTIPLYGQERYFGALTIERSESRQFSTDEVSVCKSVFALVAPVLEAKRVQAYGLVRHVWEAGRATAQKLLGPGRLEWKAVAMLLGAVALFFAFATGEHYVTAQTTIEGMMTRTIAAPFRDYIEAAYARAGDTVHEGNILCKLDDRDLRLNKTELLSQRDQLLRKQQKAVADHDWANANILAARLDQVMAQIDLMNVELRRTIIKAPFNGILVRGDLSQKIGAVVEQGQTLFQISPLSSYRVILMVNDSDISYVHRGEKGALLVSALPEKFHFVVSKVTPVTTVSDGMDCFRVEARLQGASADLRPGMEGVGKIRVGRGRLISIWTSSLRNWLRLKLWAWFP